MKLKPTTVRVVPPEPNEIGFLPYEKRDDGWYEIDPTGEKRPFLVDEYEIVDFIETEGFIELDH